MSGSATGGGGGREGGRSIKVRVKKASKFTLSSKLWLERQLNDPYVAQAKREGWRSRAAFKLIELGSEKLLGSSFAMELNGTSVSLIPDFL